MMIRKQTPIGMSEKREKKRFRRSGHGKVEATLAALDKLKPAHPKAESVIALLRSWLQDESGYDEEAWPKLKKALQQERKKRGAQGLFDV
jgi:hypothetical protein